MVHPRRAGYANTVGRLNWYPLDNRVALIGMTASTERRQRQLHQDEWQIIFIFFSQAAEIDIVCGSVGG